MQILKVLDGNEKQISYMKYQISYMNKYQKHVACSYGYKLVCVDDKFS